MSKAVVLRMDGTRRSLGRAESLPPGLAPEEQEQLALPPKQLSRAAAKWWRELAPHALTERTLTPATAAGFGELCVRYTIVDSLDRKIRQLKVGSVESLPYLKERARHAAQLSASLKDFKLCAFGKPATADRPKAPANPWAQIASQP